jgi:hypothetical protein
MATYNLFINSKNRNSSEKPYDFTLLLKNQIIVKQNEYINVNVMSFNMINSMYNISTVLKNNTFDIEIRTLEDDFIDIITYTIPDGNYSVLTLRDTLNNLLEGKINISYNYGSNTYTLFNINAGNNRYHLKNIKCCKLIGIYNDMEITLTPFTGSYANMVNYQQILLKTDLQHESLNQDTITDINNDLNISQILCWFNKQDVEPFRSISYINQGSSCFCYNILNNNISSINFTLCNERNEVITDADEWLLHLQFVVRKKEDSTLYELGKKIINLLNDINYILMNIFFKNNI